MEAITAAFWSTQVSLGTVYKINPKRPVSACSTVIIIILTSDTLGHLDSILLNGSWISEIKNLSPLIALRDAQVIPEAPRGLQRGRRRLAWPSQAAEAAGLKDVRLIISDTCLRLAEATAQCYPGPNRSAVQCLSIAS